MISKNEIKLIKSLSTKKNRLKELLFIVEGEKMVDELLSSNYKIKKIYGKKEWFENNFSKLDLIDFQKISNDELCRISNLKNPNDVLALVEMFSNELDYSSLTGTTLILDSINDPGNLGTIIRTCDWFNVRNVICSKDTVDIYNNKTIQSTMGSIFRVNVYYFELIEFFVNINSKPQTYAATLDGENLKNVKNQKDNFLIIGSESHGISDYLMKFIDEKVKIENVSPGGESLNAAIATGIILYQLS
jgi:TrmH family RNA methyltransferase